MYYITKELEISAAHKLSLDYDSKCQELHGHNWQIAVTCRSTELDKNGMVYDFMLLKKSISEMLDHRYLNDVLGMNPTAENIARWIAELVGEKCWRVEVQESKGNVAVYEVDA